jgi:transposase InsO family protein
VFKEEAAGCHDCVMGKHERMPFPHSKQDGVSGPLDELVTDLCTMPVASLGGALYILTVTDLYSKASLVRFLKRKSETAETLQEIISMLELQLGRRVKRVRSDRGGEYMGEELQSYFRRKGIIHQTTVPHTPQQNAVAERLG